MSNPYIGEIRLFGGTFAPQGWAFCEGQLLAIAENDALFTLIGTTYGGDGQTTFGLPDLRGRIPVHSGQGSGTSSRVLGQSAGAENVTLTLTQIPAHTHALQAGSGAASTTNPSGAVWAGGTVAQYSASAPDATMQQAPTQAIQSTGGTQPHDNLMPYVCVSFIISLFGIFPPQN
ncbi:MAG TPA: tail fiber protein [Candidatus Dormibacteraeota bacterium]